VNRRNPLRDWRHHEGARRCQGWRAALQVPSCSTQPGSRRARRAGEGSEPDRRHSPLVAVGDRVATAPGAGPDSLGGWSAPQSNHPTEVQRLDAPAALYVGPIGTGLFDSRCAERLGVAELALGAPSGSRRRPRAVEDDLGRLVVGWVCVPTNLVGRKSPDAGFSASRDRGDALGAHKRAKAYSAFGLPPGPVDGGRMSAKGA
jgi:hypothetical protein